MLKRSVLPAGSSPEGKRGDLIDWREQAACRDYPFTAGDDPWYPKNAAKQDTSAAMAVCWEVCPVRETCLDAALMSETSQHVHGIRGGITEMDRRSRLRRDATRRRAAAKAEAEASAAAEAAEAEAKQEDTEAA